MQLEIGKIYNGKVKGITQYGAFVDIDGGGTGMVHISEIANTNSCSHRGTSEISSRSGNAEQTSKRTHKLY